MIVSAWNNGKHYSSGGGYGIKIEEGDRDKYFDGKWESVLIKLEGESDYSSVNVDKKSFWYSPCKELISKKIGVWLIANRKAPWRKGHPPKLLMQHVDRNKFKLKLIN